MKDCSFITLFVFSLGLSSLVARQRISFKGKGDHAFGTAAPRLWNRLPLTIRIAPPLTHLKLKGDILWKH